ncbi:MULTISPECIES: hypothetical protein [unclassified Microbacterium]|uniref:hypothetical protein n=1 Tax=unclassified Microbacterium TaxID=2609290 RepID=UPI00214A8B57|nr:MULTISPECIES: hypothetical protein [unclassified Microbacterium]MCR2782983.1 hypothetical protein [Microbacterium sp. zg.B96]MDL5352245.1 hypothetical protein [Microbacterium sp. zg-YB36]WIM16130.1 hypothetical protein QNO11_00400 [Microbacterium sp. zg-B96]
MTGEFGLRIGMPTDEVRALGPDDEVTYDVRLVLRFGLERAEVGGDHAVFVHTDAAGHVVEQITYGSYLDM